MTLSLSNQISGTGRQTWHVAGKQLANNVGKTLKNSWNYQLEHPSKLKVNALILSSLILVISRVLISNHSALKAKGTPEEGYRKREAIRTTLREFGGWTLTYGVIKVIQHFIEKGLQKKFDIPQKAYSTIGDLKKSLSAFTHRQKTEIQKYTSTFDNAFKFNNTALWENKVQPWLKNTLPGKTLSKMGLNSVKRIHTWAPIVIGSIPALFLSGYLLERFTRDHSQDVVNALSGDSLDKTPLSSHGQLQRQRFQAFVGNLQHQREQRHIR